MTGNIRDKTYNCPVLLSWGSFQATRHNYQSKSQRLGVFLVEIDKLILKFIWKCKGPTTAETTLKKEKTDNWHYLQSVIPKLVLRRRQTDTSAERDTTPGSADRHVRTRRKQSQFSVEKTVFSTKCSFNWPLSYAKRKTKKSLIYHASSHVQKSSPNGSQT